MKHFDPILVVEGASDKAFISTFLEADFVITNGSEVSRETIEYLKEAKKTRDIVVLTDPDSPGKRIRDILDQNIPGLLHAFVPKEHSIKHHKVGVAESTEFDVMNALSHIIPSKAVKKGDLTLADFYDQMVQMLAKYGQVKTVEITYNTFRGSRNLQNRDIHVKEYLFVLKNTEGLTTSIVNVGDGAALTIKE